MKKLIVILSLFLSVLTGSAQQTIELTNWKFKTGDNLEWARPGFDDYYWKNIEVGKKWELQGYENYDGYAWYRIRFRLPASLKEKAFCDSLTILLGKIDDHDQTFLNGQLLGQNASLIPAGNTGPVADLSKTPMVWDRARNYTVSVNDPRLKWDQDNCLAIRVYDETGYGGLYSLPVNIHTQSFKDFLVFDMNPKPLDAKPGGTITKTIILKNLSGSREIKGKLTVEITGEDSKQTITTQTWDVTLKKGETPFDISYKGNLLQRVKATYTFTEASTGEKIVETWANFPKVDFSYAFGTPHRITVGRPTNSNRTLLDLQSGSFTMKWNYIGLTNFELATPSIPSRNSVTWQVDVKPQIDEKSLSNSTWTRMDGFLPALSNQYNDPRGSFHIEIIGGETATIGKIEIENTDKVPHQFKLVCDGGWSSRNWSAIDPERFPVDCLGLIYEDRLDRILVMGIGADYWTTLSNGRPNKVEALTFFWDLKPGEKRTAWLIQPYKAYFAEMPILRTHDWSKEVEMAKTEWYNLINRTSMVIIPDPSIQNAFYACFADLFIMREPLANGYIGVLCGTQQYRATNSSEPLLASIAFDQYGLHKEAVESQKVLLELQGADGDWADPAGWNQFYWWASGFKSWAVTEHYYLTGDREYLAKVYPCMLASSRFKEKQRVKTRIMNGSERPVNYGLMPRGIGDGGLFDDNGDYMGIFIPHNIWAVYADRLSLEAAAILGKTEDKKELQQIYQTAYADLLQTIEKGAIKEEDYRWIPGVAGKTCGSRFGVLNALFPCHLLPPNDKLITGTLRYMESNISKGGMPLHTGFQVHGSWVAMTLDNVAEAYLARGNGDKAAHYLYATLNHCTPLFTNVEERGSEPGTNELSGDLQHLWTPVAVVRIIRDMLVMEDGAGLNLALGTDRTWLASGKPVGVTDMPSHFGNVTYQIQYDHKKSTVTGEIKMEPKLNQQLCQWTTLHIRLPEGMKVTAVDKASKAEILPNGEGIRWEGQVTKVKFKAVVGVKYRFNSK